MGKENFCGEHFAKEKKDRGHKSNSSKIELSPLSDSLRILGAGSMIFVLPKQNNIHSKGNEGNI